MILYKYVSLDAGLKILESRTIGFSELRDFNDPFETAARPRGDFSDGPGFFVQSPEDTKPKKAKFLFTHNNHTSNIWSRYFAVLSLTRTPLNKLMLAHYADEHKGMVIGFDMSKVPDFMSEQWAYIPAQYGNVIYTATLPNHSTFEVGISGHLDVEKLGMEARQLAFLYKDSAWSMEEEVRIVKFLKNYENFFKVIYLDERPLYLCELPANAIAEVHLGCRARILPAMNGEHDLWLKLKTALDAYKNCRLFQINVELDKWEVTSEEVSALAYDGYWQLYFDRQATD